MGNTQSQAMRAQLTQAQRTINALKQEKAKAEAARLKAVQAQKQNSLPSQVKVNCARFSQTPSSIDEPSPVQLTLTWTDNVLNTPQELLRESSARGLALSQKRLTQQFENRSNTYVVYSGLTDPDAPITTRPGYGSQRHTFHKNLLFVVKTTRQGERDVPQPMAESDVQWVWTKLRAQIQGHTRPTGSDLRKQMEQRIGRPGVHIPYIDQGATAGADPYSIQAQLPNRPAPSSAIQFRPASLYKEEDIHYQQVEHR